MGALLRKFWHPVALSREVMNGQAMALRILGEDLILYRGESGAAHLIGGRCAHRRTMLQTGRVIGEQIRCHYHGWQYDATGQCVRRPAEKDPGLPDIRIAGYPVHEYCGLVFAWMGEAPAAEFDLPRKNAFEQPDALVVALKEPWDCNWFHQIENSLDGVHVSFAHQGFWVGPFGEAVSDDIPELSYAENEAGLEQTATRPGGNVRKGNWTFPNNNYINVPPLAKGDPWIDISVWVVPNDDVNATRFFLWAAPATTPQADLRFLDYMEKYGGYQAPEHFDELFHRRVYPDPQDVLVGLTFAQDYVAIRGQGAMADRENEILGLSDMGIVTLRRLFWRELDLQRAGKPTKQWRKLAKTTVEPIKERPVAMQAQAR
ncbi:MAG: iron-sulfur containing oxygenase [Betaproteobacteria bacterium]|nr:iron-sulfur containing oxygenase [Betaproteobacteria bacterium]